MQGAFLCSVLFRFRDEGEMLALVNVRFSICALSRLSPLSGLKTLGSHHISLGRCTLSLQAAFMVSAVLLGCQAAAKASVCQAKGLL